MFWASMGIVVVGVWVAVLSPAGQKRIQEKEKQTKLENERWEESHKLRKPHNPFENANERDRKRGEEEQRRREQS